MTKRKVYKDSLQTEAILAHLKEGGQGYWASAYDLSKALDMRYGTVHLIVNRLEKRSRLLSRTRQKKDDEHSKVKMFHLSFNEQHKLAENA